MRAVSQSRVCVCACTRAARACPELCSLAEFYTKSLFRQGQLPGFVYILYTKTEAGKAPEKGSPPFCTKLRKPSSHWGLLP